MSRVSLPTRMARIMEILRPRAGLAWCISRLNDVDRAAWQTWSERTDRIICQLKNRGSNAYEAWLDDPLMMPLMPLSLEAALFPEMVPVRAERDLAVAYTMMLKGEA